MCKRKIKDSLIEGETTDFTHQIPIDSQWFDFPVLCLDSLVGGPTFRSLLGLNLVSPRFTHRLLSWELCFSHDASLSFMRNLLQTVHIVFTSNCASWIILCVLRYKSEISCLLHHIIFVVFFLFTVFSVCGCFQ